MLTLADNFLIDTNIFLEGFLKQERASAAFAFLSKIPSQNLFISKFALYSIGIILHKRGYAEAYQNFISLFIPHVNVVELENDDLFTLSQEIMPTTKLDFDDAFQYLCAKKYGLRLVSFDSDFDKTDLKRINLST